MTSSNVFGLRRTLVTPEGVPLALECATAGDRITAFLLDFLLMVVLTLVAALVLLLPAFMFGMTGGAVFGSLFLLSTFVIWNGYFLFFELRWRGATPGKRKMGLKVVSRSGGPLTTGAVFSRNLLRELEFYLPLKILLVSRFAADATPGWVILLTCAWLFLLLLLPLLNRDRVRCGDLVAGTLVVVIPEVRLFTDQAERPGTEEPSGAFTFTREQLDMYGIRELQVLEEVLRRESWHRGRRRVLRTVCEKITNKIAWESRVPEDQVLPFLQAFYRAQRNRLEQRLLMGERREKKRGGRLGSGGAAEPPAGHGRRR